MRKILAIILTCIMLFGCMPQVLASEAAEPAEKSGLSFTQDKIYLYEDQKAMLDIQGYTLPNPNITFSSDNTTVAEVDQAGFVRAKGQGIATIKAKQNTGSTATCTVVVSNYAPMWCDYNPTESGGELYYYELGYVWDVDDWDGDGYSWMMASEDLYTVGRDDYAVCFNGGPGGYHGEQSDDTITSWCFSLPDDASSATLIFEAGKLSSCNEQLYVYIADNTYGEYTKVFGAQPVVMDIKSYGSTYAIDMTEFLGSQGIRIAFDYYADDCYGLYLDNIGVFVEYEIIDEIVIDDLSAEPVVGQVTVDYLTCSCPAYADYYVKKIDWRDKDGAVGIDEEFQSDTEYILRIKVNVNDGSFRFSPEATIMLNGGDVDYNHSTAFTFVEYDGETYCIIVGPVYAAEGDTPIKEVALDDVTLNLREGMMAGDCSGCTSSGEGFTVSTLIWHDNTNGVYLSGNDMFVAGDEYSLHILLAPKAGYEFTSSTYVTINGSTIYAPIKTILSNGNMRVESIPTICGTDLAYTPIELVEIKGVTLNPPADGIAGDYTNFSMPGDYHCTVNRTGWYNETNSYPLAPDGTFVEGDLYRFGIILVPDEGYFFPSYSDSIIITINGSYDIVDYGETYTSSENGNLYIWTKPVLCREPGEIIPIELVDISGVMLDIHDGMRESECLAYKLNTANCSVIEVVWFDDTIHDYLPSDGTFIEGHSYFIGIKLAADEGYCFTADTKAKLNGSAENVGDGYMYEADFIVKSKLIVCGAPLDITIGDVNGDGKVNTADAVVVLKISAGMVALDEKYQAAGDCNGDGKVNTADAVLILKYAAGMIESF